jgi:hypothetical protein
VARRELHADDRGDDVEGAVGEGQGLGVAGDPLDAVGVRTAAGDVEQLGDEVEPDGAARACGGGAQGEVAGAGRDVQDLGAAQRRQLGEQGAGEGVGDRLGDGG